MARNIHVERALFIVGSQNSGKSTALRSMFMDRRFGSDGKVEKFKSRVALSNERWLHLRISSPHEADDTPQGFHRKIRTGFNRSGRWNFVCPLHPTALNRMPPLITVIKQFVRAFSPERVRLVFLSPNKDGVLLVDQVGLSQSQLNRVIQRIDSIPNVECVFVDAMHASKAQARKRNRNGLFLADFFDFA